MRLSAYRCSTGVHQDRFNRHMPITGISASLRPSSPVISIYTDLKQTPSCRLALTRGDKLIAYHYLGSGAHQTLRRRDSFSPHLARPADLAGSTQRGGHLQLPAAVSPSANKRRRAGCRCDSPSGRNGRCAVAALSMLSFRCLLAPRTHRAAQLLADSVHR